MESDPALAFEPVTGLIGGIMIGSASAVALAMTGKIPGISGVVARVLRGVRGDRAWRVWFLLGLVAGAGAVFAVSADAARYSMPRSVVQVSIAGLLVGFGTRLSGGCTSGHGVCGIGRGARPSVVATVVFIACAMLTVLLLPLGEPR